MSDKNLKQELATFEKNRSKLLGSFKGRYALVKNDDVVGTFETQQDAIDAGYEKFGNVPFLVKLITEVDETINLISFRIGI